MRAAESRVAGSAVAEAPGPSTAAAADPALGQSGPVAAGLDSMVSLWPAVVDLIRSENARLAAVIEQARPVELEGDEMTVAFGLSFFKKQAERPADRMALGEALGALTGRRWRLSYELREGLTEESAEEPEEGGSEERWLARFMEEFDAEEIPAEDDGERAVTSNEKGA
jgi:hypothetical protein